MSIFDEFDSAHCASLMIFHLSDCAFRKVDFRFFSKSMEYDLGDSFSFDYEPKKIPSVRNQKENCHYDHIPFNLKEIIDLFP